MKISVILGHPYSKSFNAAIAKRVVETLEENHHDVIFHDLCAEAFNPMMPPSELASDTTEDSLIRLHQEEIKQAEGLVIVHPNWWGQPPAVLKGWVDRILRENVAYAFEEDDSGGGLPLGLLRIKKAIVLNTSNTPEERESAVFGDPLERLWKDCIFDFCGVKDFERKMFRIIVDSTEGERISWLDEVRIMMNKHFPK